jgi:hypothetical protein
MQPQVTLGLNAVIVAVTEEVPRVLTVQQFDRAPAQLHHAGNAACSDEPVLEALPSGPFDPASDRTLELGLRRWVREQSGLELGYVEQLYTFGNRNRDPLEREGGPRLISIAYLALVREGNPAGTAKAVWRDWYRYMPWEDWRNGRPAAIEDRIVPALDCWIRRAKSAADGLDRRERGDIHFGLKGAPWVPERVIDRYELIYEIGLAAESECDQKSISGDGVRVATFEGCQPRNEVSLGQPMALDHRRILASALGRLRGKLKYRPVVFELLPTTFTLLQLQRVVEALAGARLHKQNFRRLVEKGGLVERTGRSDARTGGRPAELFRFRRDVLRERPAPGVGLPSVRRLF